MNRILLALPLLAVAIPALAQDRGEIEAAAEMMQDPRAQDSLAGTLSAMVAALLDLRVGGVANAVANADPRGRTRNVDPDTTVADMAARDNPDFADDLDNDIRDGTRMLGSMAGAMAEVLPQLTDLVRDVEERVEQAQDRARR